MAIDYNDLRHYVKPGDLVTYESAKACFAVEDLYKRTIMVTAPVIKVYPYFCVTKLTVCEDCANRWDIEKINGKPFFRGGGDG